MKLDLLKEHYFYELNRKQYLEGALALPVAVFTALGGLAFTMAQSYAYSSSWLTKVFLSALVGLLGSLLAAFYYVWRTSHRFTYELIASSKDLLDHYEKVKEYLLSIHEPEAKVDAYFEDKLKQRYADATAKNKLNNDSKAAYLYRANLSLLAATLFTGCCAGPYFVNLRAKSSETQKIEIINLKELQNVKGGNMSTPQPGTTGNVSATPSATAGSATTPSSSNSTPPATASGQQAGTNPQGTPALPPFPSNTATMNEKPPATPTFPSNVQLKQGDQPKPE
jgi:hypothetical protein